MRANIPDQSTLEEDLNHRLRQLNELIAEMNRGAVEDVAEARRRLYIFQNEVDDLRQKLAASS